MSCLLGEAFDRLTDAKAAAYVTLSPWPQVSLGLPTHWVRSRTPTLHLPRPPPSILSTSARPSLPSPPSQPGVMYFWHDRWDTAPLLASPVLLVELEASYQLDSGRTIVEALTEYVVGRGGGGV